MKDVTSMTPEEREEYTKNLMYEQHELDRNITRLKHSMEQLKERAESIIGDYAEYKKINSDDSRWDDYPSAEDLLKPLKDYEKAVTKRKKVAKHLWKLGVIVSTDY